MRERTREHTNRDTPRIIHAKWNHPVQKQRTIKYPLLFPPLLLFVGSTPQVTFPPGAGHDRYEENFNGPATYPEPYVERYGIKSDFSGREPLHPTPPRPGYVPTLGQTPPSSTQGSVMMVYGLQPDKVNTDKLFNLFCLYGNVTKVGSGFRVNPPCCFSSLDDDIGSSSLTAIEEGTVLGFASGAICFVSYW